LAQHWGWGMAAGGHDPTGESPDDSTMQVQPPPFGVHETVADGPESAVETSDMDAASVGGAASGETAASEEGSPASGSGVTPASDPGVGPASVTGGDASAESPPLEEEQARKTRETAKGKTREKIAFMNGDSRQGEEARRDASAREWPT
jgi:hypothetical protein